MGRKLAIAAVLIANTAGAPLRAVQVPCPETPYIITELGAREEVIERLSIAAGVVTPYPSGPQSGARYVRAHVKVDEPPDCDWFLSVRDRDYRLIQTFGREEFPAASTRWTQRIRGDRALFDLQPCADGRAPMVVFPGYIWMPEDARNTYYSLQSAQPGFAELTTVDTSFRRLGDFTGLLMGSFLRYSWSCTGVMITPDLFLTNWHCGGPGKVRASGPGGGMTDYPRNGYWTPEIVADMVIDLSWDGDTLSRELIVSGVAARSEALDFALLRVTALDRLGPIRPVRLAAAALNRNDPIRIVHHPAGRVKQLSWNCQVRQPNRPGWQDASAMSEFTHVCDTEAGSSGAPVLTGGNELAGLHHLGFDYDTQACRYLDRENKAVKIADIMEAVRLNAPLVFAEVRRWQ